MYIRKENKKIEYRFSSFLKKKLLLIKLEGSPPTPVKFSGKVFTYGSPMKVGGLSCTSSTFTSNSAVLL